MYVIMRRSKRFHVFLFHWRLIPIIMSRVSPMVSVIQLYGSLYPSKNKYDCGLIWIGP